MPACLPRGKEHKPPPPLAEGCLWYIWSVIPVSALQVGKDQKAQAFLATLDNDPTVGKNVDCTSYYVSILQQRLLSKHAAVYAVPVPACVCANSAVPRRGQPCKLDQSAVT